MGAAFATKVLPASGVAAHAELRVRFARRGLCAQGAVDEAR
jgi:hypothetical protein